MALPTDINPFVQFAGGGADVGDPIATSLRFPNNIAYYLTGQSACPDSYTLSFWVKNDCWDQYSSFMGDYANGSRLIFSGSGGVYFALNIEVINSTVVVPNSRPHCADPTAWYHVVLISDSSANRSYCYLNGIEVTDGTPVSGKLWSNTTPYIGYGGSLSWSFNGYAAEHHFIDGVVSHTEFGRFNDDGVWVPKAYTGSYGSDGWYLKYDSTAANGVGHDHSGNGNHFTANGFDENPIAYYSPYLQATGTGFNSNTGLQAFLSSGFSEGSVTGDGLSFNPKTPIPYNTLEIAVRNTDNFYSLNGGTATAIANNVSSATYVTIDSNPGTLTSLDITSSANVGSLWGIKVNGSQLLDNLDNDVDFKDTPTNNWCVLNSRQNQDNANSFFGDGNLRQYSTTTVYNPPRGTFGVSSGKWYWETRQLSNPVSTYYPAPGVAKMDNDPSLNVSAQLGSNAEGVCYMADGQKYYNGVLSSYGKKLVEGDITGVALDMDAGTVEFYRYGVSQGVALSGMTGTWTPSVNSYNGAQMLFNFGQHEFAFDPPAGFKALNTANLPNASETAKQPDKHFGVTKWTGDGTNGRAVTGLNFQPDLVWIKDYGRLLNHNLYDSVRGVTVHLTPNENYTDQTTANSLTAFNADGFDVGTGANDNSAAEDYVAWCWKAGETPSVTYTVKVVSDSGNKYRFNDFGTSAVTLDLEEGGVYVFDQSDSSNDTHPLRFSTTSDGTHGGGSEYTTGVVATGVPGQAGAKTTITVAAGAPTLYYYCSVHSGMGGQANTNDTKGSSNFDGGIQSRVTANTDAGFSIVTYAGNSGTLATVGHGLNQPLDSMWIKRRTANDDWVVYHRQAGATHYAHLNTSANFTTNSAYFNDTNPTDSVFTVNTASGVNAGSNYVAYCFHDVPGYSKFGMYGPGTSDTEGPYAHCGFKPSFVMIMRVNGGGAHWYIYDDERYPTNPNSNPMWADETTNTANAPIEFTATGFKLSNSQADINANNDDYVYWAFAANPFGGGNVAPSPAR